MGEALLRILRGRDNVSILTNADVARYEVEKDTGLVTSAVLKDGRRQDCDVVVVAAGPSAAFHIQETLGEIVPMIQGQGYVLDVHYDKDKIKCHTGDNILLSNSILSCAQMEPGVLRLAACCDFGLFRKPKFDEERWAFI